MRLVAPLSFALVLAGPGCGGDDASPEPPPGADASLDAPADRETDVASEALDAPAEAGPLVPVSGKAFVFGPASGDLVGANVAVAGDASSSAALGADGTFSLRVPSGRAYSFVVTKPGFHETQTALLDVGPAGLSQVGFQVPSDAMFALLAALVNGCQPRHQLGVGNALARHGVGHQGDGRHPDGRRD